MKKIIPFNNVLDFNTDVKEITAISLEHEIKKYPDMISGVFYVSGEYKITEGLLEREKFNFELPFDIALTNNYDLDTLLVDIDDFRYDLISDKSLKVNIDLYIDGEEVAPPEPRNVYTEELIKDDDRDLRELTDDILSTIKTASSKEESTEPTKEPKGGTKEKTTTELSKESDDKISTTKEPPKEKTTHKAFQVEDHQKEITEESNNQDELEKDSIETEESSDDVIEPERIDLLKDMLTNNHKENNMNEGLNINITNNNENGNTNENDNNNIANNLFNPDGEEQYVTYRVYKVLDTDTIDTILTKYNVTKEMLSDYNNIENITPGDKLIIPTNEK